MVALNAQLRRDGGSEFQNWGEMVALNAETEKDDFERQTEKRWWLWTPSCKEMVALNTIIKN